MCQPDSLPECQSLEPWQSRSLCQCSGWPGRLPASAGASAWTRTTRLGQNPNPATQSRFGQSDSDSISGSKVNHDPKCLPKRKVKRVIGCLCLTLLVTVQSEKENKLILDQMYCFFCNKYTGRTVQQRASTSGPLVPQPHAGTSLPPGE